MPYYPKAQNAPILIARDGAGVPRTVHVPLDKGWYDVVVLLEKDGWFAQKGAMVQDEEGEHEITLTGVRKLTTFERLRPLARMSLRIASRVLANWADSF